MTVGGNAQAQLRVGRSHQRLQDPRERPGTQRTGAKVGRVDGSGEGDSSAAEAQLGRRSHRLPAGKEGVHGGFQHGQRTRYSRKTPSTKCTTFTTSTPSSWRKRAGTRRLRSTTSRRARALTRSTCTLTRTTSSPPFRSRGSFCSRQFEPQQVGEILLTYANTLVQKKDFQKAEQVYIQARKPEMAVSEIFADPNVLSQQERQRRHSTREEIRPAAVAPAPGELQPQQRH